MQFLVENNDSDLYKVVELDNFYNFEESYYTKEDLLIEDKKNKILGVLGNEDFVYFTPVKIAQYVASRSKLNGDSTVIQLMLGENGSNFAALEVVADTINEDDSGHRLIVCYGVEELPDLALDCACEHTLALHYVYDCDLVLPSTVKVLHKFALGTTKYRNIDLTDYKGVIEPFAFQGATFHHLRLPSKMKELPQGAFAESTFTRVLLPDNLISIGDYAFYKSTGFEIFLLSDNLENVGKFSFYMSSIHAVSFPKSVNYVGECAFSKCSSLRYVEISGSSDNIAETAFEGSGSISIISGTVDSFRKFKFGCYKTLDGVYKKIPSGGARLSTADGTSITYKPLEVVYLLDDNGDRRKLSVPEYYTLIGVGE